MDPDHDWKLRLRVNTSGAGYVQVEALEFVLFEYLSWDIVLRETDEILFQDLTVRLRTYWSEREIG